MLKPMKPPLFVRPLTDEERHHLEGGLRSKKAFTLRRCQILLASAQQHTPAQIAKHVGCSVRSRTCSLRIMFRDLSHTAWARGISQSYTLPTSFQSPCPPLCPSLYAHPSRSLPRSSTGILC